jgi:hypothetical protein
METAHGRCHRAAGFMWPMTSVILNISLALSIVICQLTSPAGRFPIPAAPNHKWKITHCRSLQITCYPHAFTVKITIMDPDGNRLFPTT